ncbi:hypothetical protein OROMI_021142 [Orobanche minor]
MADSSAHIDTFFCPENPISGEIETVTDVPTSQPEKSSEDRSEETLNPPPQKNIQTSSSEKSTDFPTVGGAEPSSASQKIASHQSEPLDLGRFLFPSASNISRSAIIADGSSSSPIDGGDGTRFLLKDPVPLKTGAQKQGSQINGSSFSAGSGLGASNPVLGPGSALVSGGAGSAQNPASCSKVGIGSTPPDPKSVVNGTRNPVFMPPVVAVGENVLFNPADLRGAVSSETWARFPEEVWKEAAVIVSEILKLNSGGPPLADPLPAPVSGDSSSSASFWEEAARLADHLEKGGIPAAGDVSSAPPINSGISSVIPPVVKPSANPVTPEDPLNNGPVLKALSFADLVSKESGSIENIGTTDFSGPLPTAVFYKEECEIVSVVYKNALIGKFSYGKPDNFAIANSLFNAGFGKWFPMRLFKWDPFFDFKQEPALVPIWVKIKALPIQWFDPRPLITIGSLMGTFLKADNLTLNRSRLDFARICVEINLKNTPPKAVGVTCGTIFKEFEVEYEKLPSFCHHCQHLGHDIDACYIKNPSLKPQTFTNKFLTLEKNKNKGKEKEEWFNVGKGKNVSDPSPSGQNIDEVFRPPPLATNVSLENAGDISGVEVVLVDNRFASLEAMA